MKYVEVCEFSECADTYLAANEPLTFTREGRSIRVYLPFPAQATLRKPTDTARAAASAARLAATLDRIYAETGMTEDEFIAAFMDDSPPQRYQ